jgi:DNA-binding NarL/FixJ family response regulator
MNARKDGEAGALRIVLADSRPWVRSALKLMVEQDGTMTVSAEVAKAQELAKELSLSCPDAILLDCDLPGLRVGEFLPQLHSLCPLVRVVAMCSRPEMQKAALSAGANAFVCKTEPPEKLLAALRVCLEAVGTSKPMD